MEVYGVCLPNCNTTIPVYVERKKMKTCRLKVFPDKTVKFSVPESTPQLWIEQYLDSKNQWIGKKIQVFERTKGYAATNEIRNGISIRYLGEDLVFSISQGSNKIYKEGKILHICVTDINNQGKL